MKFCLSLLLLFSGTLFSQEAPVKHTLRILPLGDPPPFIQEVRNGVRYEVPAEEGTIPPRNIALSAVAPKGEEQEKFPMRLRLGVASTPLEFPLPADRSLEAKLETGGTWLKVPLSKTNSTLALV